MCKDFLNETTIQLQKKAADRDEAIYLAARPLVSAGVITEGYVTQMIDAVKEMGPYMVLMPGVALAHGRPSENVLKDGMSLLTLSEPVVFGHPQNDPVNIVFVLAAKETGCHLQALKDISKLLINEEFMATLGSTNDVTELMKYFNV